MGTRSPMALHVQDGTRSLIQIAAEKKLRDEIDPPKKLPTSST